MIATEKLRAVCQFVPQLLGAGGDSVKAGEGHQTCETAVCWIGRGIRLLRSVHLNFLSAMAAQGRYRDRDVMFVQPWFSNTSVVKGSKSDISDGQSL